jgi:hypothetical protein
VNTRTRWSRRSERKLGMLRQLDSNPEGDRTSDHAVVRTTGRQDSDRRAAAAAAAVQSRNAGRVWEPDLRPALPLLPARRSSRNRRPAPRRPGRAGHRDGFSGLPSCVGGSVDRAATTHGGSTRMMAAGAPGGGGGGDSEVGASSQPAASVSH